MQMNETKTETTEDIDDFSEIQNYEKSTKRVLKYIEVSSMKSASSIGSNSSCLNYEEVSEQIDKTVTAKFTTYEGEMFTKAFTRTATIADIKAQLMNLFAKPCEGMCIERVGETLPADAVLADLGIDELGAIELDIKTEGPCVLNRDLIYGHIPVLDVITIRASGIDLIVEIENHCREKEWLGGYRNKLTKVVFHHASTQTRIERDTKKRCQYTQTFKDGSTNTPKSRSVQTGFMPSVDDVILNVGEYTPHSSQITTTYINEHVVEEVETILDVEGKTDDVVPEIPLIVQLQSIRDGILKWNALENKKLRNLNDSERRVRRVELMDRTRKFLLRVERETRKLLEATYYENEKRVLTEAAKPKTFICKTGDRVSIDTIASQQARVLNELYVNYKNEKVSKEEKMKATIDLRTFFTRISFDFADDIVRLLQQELDLLTNGLLKTPSLEARIERFIFYFVKRSLLSFASGTRQELTTARPDMTHYRNILRKLQDDEMTKFKCFTSVAFKMRASEMWYLVHEIWQDTSASDECRDVQRLRMTRWRKTAEWSPWNCILLAKHETKSHLKWNDVEKEYERCFVSKVRNKHVRAKIHFNEMSTFGEGTNTSNVHRWRQKNIL